MSNLIQILKERTMSYERGVDVEMTVCTSFPYR